MTIKRCKRDSRIFRLMLLAVAFVLTSSSAAAQLLNLPVSAPSVALNSTATDLVYRIDLDSLPARPVIVVDVAPDAAHADMEIEIEITNFSNPSVSPNSGCPLNNLPPGSWLSNGVLGDAHLEAELFFCSPSLNFWNGNEADIRIRAIDFGVNGAPATLDVSIVGITRVPTDLIIQQVSGSQTVRETANQDSVLYQDSSSASNGAGEFLWSGTRVFYSPITPFPFTYRRNAILKFQTLDTVVPANAIVTDVTVELAALSLLGPVSSVSLYAVADSASNSSWWEGTEDAGGSEFFGVTGSGFAVDWLDRTSTESWTTGGGDTAPGGALDSLIIGGSGTVLFESPALVAAVQDMVDRDDWNDGFLLRGPFSSFTTTAVQFASSEHADPALRPQIEVGIDHVVPIGEGRVDPDLVDFVDEGNDFHWIYDLDNDGFFTTDIGGVCEDLLGPFDEFTFPYRYTYTGDPAYVGLDCCSWRIDSLESGTVGTGQALFFHNLDAGDPANMPPDFDGDGLLDPCDNCIYTPNGPLLGSCMDGPTNHGTCLSDLDCTGAGEVCDLSQLDDDGNRIGNACPEPSFATGLLLGVLGVVRLRARGAARQGPTA